MINDEQLREELLKRLDKIEYHVTQTNGRIRDLELWRAGIKGFIAAVTLVASIPGLLVTVLLLAGKI